MTLTKLFAFLLFTSLIHEKPEEPLNTILECYVKFLQASLPYWIYQYAKSLKAFSFGSLP